MNEKIVFKEVADSLFEISHKSIFVSGYSNLLYLLDMLYRQNPSETKAWNLNDILFLKFRINGRMHTGIMKFEDEKETRSAMFSIPEKLADMEIELLNIHKLPLKRISLFPIPTITELLSRGLDKLTKQYWEKFTDDIEAITNWYKEYLEYSREIVLNDIPELGIVFPNMSQNQTRFVLFNKAQGAIATRSYINDYKNFNDVVNAKETSKAIKHDELSGLFSESFDLPSEQLILNDSIFLGGGPKPFHRWEHPYVNALNDIEKLIKKFNAFQPRKTINAYSLSDEMIHYWTRKQISKIRSLAKAVPEFEEPLKFWLDKIQVTVTYYLHKPKKNWVSDGSIHFSYISEATRDEIMVKRISIKEADEIYKKETMRAHIPTKKKPYQERFSSILYYLEDK